jgi:AcrR family transcriptional regulator
MNESPFQQLMSKQQMSIQRKSTFVVFSAEFTKFSSRLLKRWAGHMADICTENMDPRIRRTRLLLQQALGKLLETKEFEKISVQDIADAATVNRATFYDHYNDKFALLECMVGTRFGELLAARGVRFDGGCTSALRGMVLGVCDFLAAAPGMECERQLQMEPHMEAAVIAVVRRMILDGLQSHPAESDVSPEMLAATLSWAMYGAAKEWLHTAERATSEEVADRVMRLLEPVFGAVYAVVQA